MFNLLLSYVRTYVPIGVGAALSWLTLTYGIVVPEETSAALATGLTVLATAVITVIYYGLVRALETRWPWFGKLLGARASVSYKRPEPAAVTAMRSRTYG